MKIIDLLNKIANGEIKEDTLIEFDNGYKDYCSVRTFFDRYIVDRENLNCEVEILEEEKKIPEKLENEHEFYSYVKYEKNKDEIDKVVYILKAINLAEEKIDNLNNSINSIIDYLKSKGE